MTSSFAIVGASVRAAAASARRAGYEPIAADLFADEDLRRWASATRVQHYPRGLVGWLRGQQPWAWMYTGALENHPELVDEMGWISSLWGNDGDVLRRVRSPWQLTDVLGEAGLLFPETRDAADGLPRDGSWLAKTCRGSSGSGVWALDDTTRPMEDDRRRHAVPSASCLPASLSPWLVFQRRVAGESCSAVFVAAGGRAALLGVVQQVVGGDWLGAREFQYAGSIGPWPLADKTRATVARIGDVLASQFALAGLFGVDLVIDGATVWTIEVNPRYTASVEVVERATGISALAAHVAACRDGRLESRICRTGNVEGARPEPPLAPSAGFRGKVVLFARRNVVVDEPFAAWALEEALLEPWPRMADAPAAGTPIAVGRPVVTLFSEGTAVEDVQARLRERVADTEGRLYAGRD